ncbi:hypothetical protein F959_01597 [Acinetobacter venetianus RAG-1 = CIP 110063]|uniref:Arc-like DNA binding domain-containing protein n=3 Tax=Acinetobacter venetianus TaxID=52133 RepID=N8ZUN1_ACIVR|nr:Arc family DNA-binding protein [Acinetobacter venetianus]ENV37474.1 hypothetical protein F959_01597 [Acinetobacter venetianus RAG-1 = CIP 110063]
MARTVPQFNLRVPQELKQIVEDAAKKSGRSINAEAVFRLEQSFTQDKKLLEISSVMTKTMTNSLETIDTALSKIVHVYLKSGFVMYSASSFDAEGKIYFTNLISYIHKYSDQDMSEFLNSLKNNSHDEYIKSIKNEYQLYRVIDFKSLIIHEQTHFLDLTSSLWGLEFSIRKNNVFLTKNNVEEQKNALNVFSLNYSELLKMHRPLNKNDNLLFDYRKVINYKHFYYYDENVGVCLEIQLNYKNSSISVPVSMLSVLESHAFSNEYLSKYMDASKIKNLKIKQKIINQIHENYINFMNNPIYHEYNILLKLIDIHYSKFGLNIIQKLKLCSAITGLCLDMGGLMMSSISNEIYKTIGSHYKYSIKADWMRGSSRHILAIKIILLMFDYIKSLKKVSEIQKMKNLLKYNPLNAINNFIEKLTTSYESLKTIEKIEKETYLNILQKKPFAKSNIIFSNSLENNAAYINSQYVLNSLNNYRLLMMFRDDEDLVHNFIEFPLTFAINIEVYSNEPETEELSIIDEILTIDKLKKFHMDNLEAERMVNANKYSANFNYDPALS